MVIQNGRVKVQNGRVKVQNGRVKVQNGRVKVQNGRVKVQNGQVKVQKSNRSRFNLLLISTEAGCLVRDVNVMDCPGSV